MTWKSVKIADLDANTRQEAEKNMEFWRGKKTSPPPKARGKE